MKKLENIICVVSIIMIAWFIISYIDVIAHQNCGGTDAVWNLFNIMFNIFK